MPQQPPPDLPPKYYLGYFRYVLDFVKRHYEALLTTEELAFFDVFTNLSEDAQCLYVRMSNRKGVFFRPEKLAYAELSDHTLLFQELKQNIFVKPLEFSSDTPFLPEILSVFSKPELLALARTCGWDVRGKASLKKEEFVVYLTDNISYDALFEAITTFSPIVRTGFEAEVMLIKFLFFGNRHADLTEFVVRDLGYLRFEHFDDDRFIPHFTTRQEVEDRLAVSLAKEQLSLMTEADGQTIFHWFMAWHTAHQPISELAVPALERLIIKTGMALERLTSPDHALEVYRLTETPPTRERQVRILQKLKDLDTAEAIAREILASPKNAEEQFFAEDFLGKLSSKKAKKAITVFLENSPSIGINISWKYRVEEGVATHYREQGYEAVHAENWLFDGLFGLLFWDIIFDGDAIHQPFQRSPSDIYKPIFFEKRRSAILERLEILDDPAETQQLLSERFTQKYGTVNPLVVWFPEMLELVNILLKYLPTPALKTLLTDMATNLREHTRGFPDLLVWKGDDYELIEVKSPTDHLSAQQLYWLRFFERVGIRASVMRVIFTD